MKTHVYVIKHIICVAILDYFAGIKETFLASCLFQVQYLETIERKELLAWREIAHETRLSWHSFFMT